ncbi:Reverse transcriptase [Phytophthora palmivora]|uniref:Reverse transcriptase n=1 Tax=Phytophthora palmivora TaxID=4796 RepID=A0A2P4YHU5_9STRA|nr:Reverse transcriptase [Phytophthora palmivora]
MTLQLEDYAHELAFLPDVSEEVPIELDYNGVNAKCSAHTPEQATRLTELLKRNEKIMISSGNALPPPAYGVVCDIDVGDRPPRIKQRARRVAQKYLKPLYELLKGLLRAKLVSFSKSPWASAIVIVLKKNGVDIRLCIDYKKVNAITMIMEYAMPLVDDLLSELEKYLWFCSLDAASGFWAVMMTRRARRISAFVCALGHFEWLRMPFGLKNAPMIYQRMIDNALRGSLEGSAEQKK